MHIGILKIKNKKIYIDIENNKIISYYYKNKQRRDISLEALNYIVTKLFFNQSQEKFLYEENGYQVYKNIETGYKHYYKNDKQDYIKFYLENGNNAILNKEISTLLTKKLSKAKQKVTIPKFIKFGQALLIGSSLYFGSLEVTEKVTMRQIEIEKEVSEILKDIEELIDQENPLSEKMEYTTILEYINDSENLTEEQKMLLSNKNLIIDISNTPMTEDRIADLETSLTDIQIVLFTQDDIEENNYRQENDLAKQTGYYNLLEPNILHIADLTDINTICHEYIHLLQDNNEYHYLREASAEIIASEYFYNKINSYYSPIIRTRVLMEIIGTDPIWELNFSGKTDRLEEILDTYLSSEESEELKELFMISPSQYNAADLEEINQEIDQYLSKLYTSIYNEPIENNEIINYLYNNSAIYYTTSETPRHYFSDSENIEGRLQEVTREISVSDAITAEMIKCYKTTEEEISKTEYEQGISSGKKVYFSIKPSSEEVSIEAISPPETDVSYYLVNNQIKVLTEQDLVNQGYAVPDKYYQIKEELITTNQELVSAYEEEEKGKCLVSYIAQGNYKTGKVFTQINDDKETIMIEITQQVNWEPVKANIPENTTQKK